MHCRIPFHCSLFQLPFFLLSPHPSGGGGCQDKLAQITLVGKKRVYKKKRRKKEKENDDDEKWRKGEKSVVAPSAPRGEILD